MIASAVLLLLAIEAPVPVEPLTPDEAVRRALRAERGRLKAELACEEAAIELRRLLGDVVPE